MFLRKSELGREVITQHGIEGAGSVLLPTPTSLLHPLIITMEVPVLQKRIIVESQSKLYPKNENSHFSLQIGQEF